MCGFTLVALRWVNTFYSKRVKDVQTFHCKRTSRDGGGLIVQYFELIAWASTSAELIDKLA